MYVAKGQQGTIKNSHKQFTEFFYMTDIVDDSHSLCNEEMYFLNILVHAALMIMVIAVSFV